MLTRTDNESLTRVGPGTPMGIYMRRHWIPFLLSEELVQRDGAPLRVRLLGEDLIAFRDTDGRLGLLDRYCPHRRVDLFFGRNEDCGLRCVYHGWKFDVTGAVTDMPAEPAGTPLLESVRIKSYPIREWGGVIWAYMGDSASVPPAPPQLEWGLVPDNARLVTKRLQQNNYAQSLEGGIDSAHVGILHSRLDPEKAHLPFGERQLSVSDRLPHMGTDKTPRFFVRPADYGLMIGARRNSGPDSYYWRITQFLLPFYTIIPRTSEDDPITGHAWVPIDDENTWTFTMTWHPKRALTEKDIEHTLGIDVPVLNDGSYRPQLDRSTEYGLDRDMQRLRNATGIDGIGLQDAAVQESMGPIVDRSLETLGATDAAIVAFRRLMLRNARGTESDVAATAQNPDWYRVRSAGVVLPRETDFVAGAAPFMAI